VKEDQGQPIRYMRSTPKSLFSGWSLHRLTHQQASGARRLEGVGVGHHSVGAPRGSSTGPTLRTRTKETRASATVTVTPQPHHEPSLACMWINVSCADPTDLARGLEHRCRLRWRDLRHLHRIQQQTNINGAMEQPEDMHVQLRSHKAGTHPLPAALALHAAPPRLDRPLARAAAAGLLAKITPRLSATPSSSHRYCARRGCACCGRGGVVVCFTLTSSGVSALTLGLAPAAFPNCRRQVTHGQDKRMQ
jgi:hypothetical protein